MTLLSETQIEQLRSSGMRVPDVNSTCIGCSACVAICPEVFEMNDEGKSEIIEHTDYSCYDVDDAIMACPVDAISWGE